MMPMAVTYEAAEKVSVAPRAGVHWSIKGVS